MPGKKQERDQRPKVMIYMIVGFPPKYLAVNAETGEKLCKRQQYRNIKRDLRSLFPGGYQRIVRD